MELILVSVIPRIPMNSLVKQHQSKLLRLATWALCAAPFVFVAEQVSTPTSGPRSGQVGVFEHSRVEAERYRLLHGPISEEDWRQASKFLQDHSPSRWIQFKNLPAPSEHRENLKRFLVNRWRGIAELKDSAPELYKIKVREVEVDDNVFGICLTLKHGHKDKLKLQTDLKTAIDELFVLGLAERKQRISLVKKSLDVQEKALASDDRNKVQIVAERYEQILKHGVEGARIDKLKGKNGSKPSSTSPGETESEPPQDTPGVRN
jgi:hypothetical protein